MNGVIVELRARYAAVLTDDGRIEKVNNQNYAIGQVISMNTKTKSKPVRFVATAAAAAAVMLVCGVGAYAYYTPYSYVSLDVNPSIEYSLNRFDRVLKVKGINDDGKQILEEVQLKNLSNKTIDEAIAETVRQISEDGFFDGEVEGGIVIATSGKDLKKAGQLAEQLKKSAADAADEEVEVETLAVGKERVEEARALGVTPGKLNLVEKLQASAEQPDEIDLEDWLEKPVRDIMKQIKDNKKADQEKSKEEKFDQEEDAEDKAQSKAEKMESKVEKAESKAAEKQEKGESKQAEKEERAESKNEAKADKDSAQAEKNEAAAEKPEKEKSEKQNNGNSK